jgi:hypothetical protein
MDAILRHFRKAALMFFSLRYRPIATIFWMVAAGCSVAVFILWWLRPGLVRSFLGQVAAFFPDLIVAIFHEAINVAGTYPGPTVTFVGLAVPFLIFLLARPDRKLQRRRVYMDLEFESARIFRTCVDHPEIVNYLEGRSAETDIDSDVAEKVYWHVCQILNTFELMISLYKEGMVQIDVFSTWVSWFHELGTARRFGEFWDGRGLSFHYKIEIQEIMDKSQSLLRNRTATTVDDDELGAFHRAVSNLLGDRRILQHFEKSQTVKARRISEASSNEIAGQATA